LPDSQRHDLLLREAYAGSLAFGEYLRIVRFQSHRFGSHLYRLAIVNGRRLLESYEERFTLISAIKMSSVWWQADGVIQTCEQLRQRFTLLAFLHD